MRSTKSHLISIALGALLSLPVALGNLGAARAADHGDGPTVAHDQAADLADQYFFVDPNDSSKLILISTFRGFIVPGEAVNFGIFDPAIRYRLEIENTGDAKPDRFIDVSFSQRTSTAAAQMATVRLSKGEEFTAPATNPSLAGGAPAPVITDSPGGISFFAGEVDDPFFFDIPGFARFVASVRAGATDPTRLDRGRNTFAGYNVMAIALRLPVSLLKGDSNVIGVDCLAQRRKVESPTRTGEIKSAGAFRTVDREGNPAVNVVLVPFALKNEYNAASTRDDAAGDFATDIVGTLTALGTNQGNIDALASIAVTNGDFLRLDVSIPNTGAGGGDNPAAAFPNGRRLKDDVVDTLLFIVTNGAISAGDNVDANDAAFRDTFPFLAAPQQPREGAGNVEDNTRN